MRIAHIKPKIRKTLLLKLCFDFIIEMIRVDRAFRQRIPTWALTCHTLSRFSVQVPIDSGYEVAAVRRGSVGGRAFAGRIHLRRFSTLTSFDSLSASRKRRASSGVIIWSSEWLKPILIPWPPVLLWILMTNETLSRSIIDPL